MPLDELWPDWCPAWLVHEDPDLFVVNKPAGMVSLPTDRSLGEDMLSRLRAHVAPRLGRDPSEIAATVPMDRAISGLMLFARRGRASQSLSRQLTAGLERRWIAGVPAPHHLDLEPLSHRTVASERGRMLLEIRQRSRRHRLRSELAKLGSPVAGDVTNGGAEAWRLMLHAARVTLNHPTNGRVEAFRAPLPAAMDRWLRGARAERYDAEELCEAVRAAAHLRFGLARDPATTAYRLVHGAADHVPGVTVDRYDDHLVVGLTGDAVAHREAILDALESLGPRGIYLKLRPKQASNLSEHRRAELAPAAPARGAAAPDRLAIREAGLPFEVSLGDGLSTGIFLDQRDNRARLRGFAAGARVLNLFAYTGAFTVAAVAGGARQTVSVDASRTALARAERAIRAVSSDTTAHRVQCADALEWLRQAARRRHRFDLAVLDPPSFATTRRSRFRAAHDYRAVAAAALRCVAPGGRLLACTNHRGVSSRQLRQAVERAADDARCVLARVEALPPPVDFPPHPQRGAHLKTIVAEVSGR